MNFYYAVVNTKENTNNFEHFECLRDRVRMDAYTFYDHHEVLKVAKLAEFALAFTTELDTITPENVQQASDIIVLLKALIRLYED